MQTTVEKIKQIIESGEQVTVSDVASMCGVSKQRVHQVMTRYGLRAPLDGRLATVKVKQGSPGMTSPSIVTGGIQSRVSVSSGAQISELLVSADLMSRAYKVFSPVSRTSVYDLLVVNPFSGEIKKIEVKCGKRCDSGRLVYQRNSGNKTRHVSAIDGVNAAPDHYAIVVAGEPVVYEPDIGTAS